MWALLKDLCSGSLKKVEISEVYEILSGKRLVPYSPKHHDDFSSRKHYGRVKRDEDGVKRVRRVRILQIKDASEELNMVNVKNPTYKKQEVELFSDYTLTQEVKTVKNKRKDSKNLTNTSDMNMILKKFKGNEADKAGCSNQSQQSKDNGNRDPQQQSNIEMEDGSLYEKVINTSTEYLVNHFTIIQNNPDSKGPSKKTTAAIPIPEFVSGLNENKGPEAVESSTAQHGSPYFSFSSESKVPEGSSTTSAANSVPELVPGLTGTTANEIHTPESLRHVSNPYEILQGEKYNEPMTSNNVDDTFEMENRRPRCCCPLVLTELKQLQEEVAGLKDLIKGNGEQSTSNPQKLWPIYNAVYVDQPPPPGTPKNMIYCGDTAKCLAVTAVDRCFMSNLTLRSTVNGLVSLMFPENLHKYGLQVKHYEGRLLFPRDAIIAITNLINANNRYRAKPGQSCQDITSAMVSDRLSKILSLLRGDKHQ
ncbi:Triosephosphate isomerase [Frankliniella fusca]|uniref:Triosephosphate isomerase n=1 Tax=Frankliniella fusca TaxID=407009 RepID=A0AAE1HX85_9NEOP|nr:Triosephosphate isomerase [Frankliniella fusca]